MKRVFLLSLFSLCLTFSQSHASPTCGDGIDAELAAKICPYLDQLKGSSVKRDQLIASEVERALYWSQQPTFDALPAGKIIPNFFKDLVGHNGWQKGNADGVNIPLEDLIFRPLLTDVSAIDFRNAFGRDQNLSGIQSICQYTEPKRGTGTRPGFKVSCDGLKLKVKFREIHTQPLATRVFWALGYQADPADYHSGMKISYDRKIFEEFNSRVGVPLKLKFGRKELTVTTLNPHYDPFRFMKSAVLKSGQAIDVATLSQKYLAGDDGDIDYVITAPVQLQYAKVKGRIEVGPWSFSDFDHSRSKALRAVGVLSAWLGLYDVRRNNNALVLDNVNGQLQPKFLFPDLGSGLGRSRYRMSLFDNIEDPSDFKSVITRRHHLTGVQVNETNEAFVDATKADFAYGVSLINQFTEAQIRQLVEVSGFAGKDLEVYTRKLIERRKSLNRAYTD